MSTKRCKTISYQTKAHVPNLFVKLWIQVVKFLPSFSIRRVSHKIIIVAGLCMIPHVLCRVL
jgi:hypothetical protein